MVEYRHWEGSPFDRVWDLNAGSNAMPRRNMIEDSLHTDKIGSDQ